MRSHCQRDQYPGEAVQPKGLRRSELVQGLIGPVFLDSYLVDFLHNHQLGNVYL